MILQCVICFEVYTSNDEVIITECGHLFHKLCIREWFRHQPNCAQCRANCAILNLKRVYLNSASNDDVHLARHCNVKTVLEDLKNSKTILNSTQDELHSAKIKIEELETMIASLEIFNKKIVCEKEHLDDQLNLAVQNWENTDKDLKGAQSEVLSLKNTVCSATSASKKFENSASSLEKELKTIKVQKQRMDNDLRSARDEICQMKQVTQALAINNLANYSPADRENALNNLANYSANVRENFSQSQFNRQNCRQRLNRNEHRNQKIDDGKESTSVIQGDKSNTENLSNKNNNLKERNNNRSHNGNARRDNRRQPNRLNYTKPKEIENNSSDPTMASLDEPWW